MARKSGTPPTGGSGSLGTLQVDIVGNLEPLGKSIEEAKGMLQSVQQEVGSFAAAFNKAQKTGEDGARKRQNPTITVNITANQSALEASIKAVTSKKYKLTFDLSDLETKLEALLGKGHNITVNGVSGGLSTTMPSAERGSTVTRNQMQDVARVVTPELKQALGALSKKLKGDLSQLASETHAELVSAMRDAGRDFGKIGAASGDLADQLLDIFDLVGTNLKDVKFEPIPKGGGAQRIASGPLSAQGLTELGVPAERAPFLSSLMARLIGPPNEQGQGTGANLLRLIDPLRKALEAQAAAPQPASPAAQPTRPAPVIREEIANITNAARTEFSKTADVIEKELKEYRSAAEKGLKFERLDPSRFAGAPLPDMTVRPGGPMSPKVDPTERRRLQTERRRLMRENEQLTPQQAARLAEIDDLLGASTGRGGSPTAGRTLREGGPRVANARRESDDVEADAQARRQLGPNNRANQRRMRGMPLVEDVGGFRLNLEPFLRFAEVGGFQDIFEQRTGKGFKESQGFGPISAADVGSEERLKELRNRKGGSTIPTLGEGKFFPVEPREALLRTVIESLGIEEDSATTDLIRERVLGDERVAQALDRGRSPARSGGRRTNRGQTVQAPVSGSVAPGTQRGDLGGELRRMYDHLANIDDQIENYTDTLDRLNSDISRMSGSGQDVTGLEEQARGLGKAIQRMRGQRSSIKRSIETTLGPISPEQYGLIRENARASNAASRERIEAGRNTPRERYYSPEAIGERQRGLITAGEMPNPQEMLSELVARYLESPDMTTPTGRVMTARGQLRKLAYGDKGRPGTGGLYGEVTGALDEDFLGKEEFQAAKQSIRNVFDSFLESQSDAALRAEKDIYRKEGMTRSTGRSRSVNFAIMGEAGPRVWDESNPSGDISQPGQFSYRNPITGEGQYIGVAPGIEGRTRGLIELNRQRKAGTAPMPGDMSEFPYFDPDEAEANFDQTKNVVANILAEREKSMLARAKTLGKGTYQTGDSTTDLARAAGLVMPDEERIPPFAGAFGRDLASRGELSGLAAGAWGPGSAMAGGPGGPAGGGPGGPSGPSDGWDMSQPIHVIVDSGSINIANWPAGLGGRGRAAAAGAVAGAVATDEEKKEEAETKTTPRRIDAIERAMEADFVAALRSANDPRAMRAFDQRTYARETAMVAGSSPTAAEKDFLAALEASSRSSGAVGQAADARRREMEVRRMRREAQRNDPQEFARQQDIEDLRQRDLRGDLRALNRRIPRRGFGASITDLVSSMAPGSGALERQLEAGDLAMREATEISQTSRQRASTRTSRRALAGQIRAARESGDSATAEALLPMYREQVALGKAQNAIIRESTIRFRAFHEEATKGTTVLKSFGAAAAGSVISTGINAFTIGLGMALFQPLIEGVGTATIKGLDRMLGSPMMLAEVSAGLADSVRQAGGRADVGVAAVAAQSGLAGPTYGLVAPDLETAAGIEAGNKALEEQFNMVKLFEATQMRGAEAGAFQTLGGIGGSWVAGVTPATEQIGALIAGSGAYRTFAGAENTRIKPDPNNLVEMLFGVPKGETPTDALIGNTDKLNARLERINEVLGKADETTIRFTDSLAFSKDQLAAQADVLEEWAPQLAGPVRRGQAAIVDESGNLAMDGEKIASDIAAAVREASKPSPEALVEQMRPQIEAQEMLRTQRRGLTLDTLQPAERAFSEAMNPVLDANVGINTTGLSGSALKEVNSLLGDTQSMIDSIRQDAEAGFKVAVDFVRSANLGGTAAQDFETSLSNVQAIGQQIASIQIDVSTKQAAYAAHQFEYQIALAKRSLADAKGLVSGIGNGLGALQRQMYNLQRESQALAMGMSQAQINFQKAVAGFQIAGLTPAEMAARIKQAKLEADYAQKQLDIQKQLFNLSGKSFEITASRNVQDLVRQIGLLEEGREVTLYTAAAEKKIAALTKLQEKEAKKMNAIFNDAVEKTQDLMGLQAQLVTATGKGLVAVSNAVLKAFYSHYGALVNHINKNLPGGGNTPLRDDTGNTGHGAASGALFNTRGETDLTVGEAGTETVAVLRNPRKVMGGLGGGTTLVINVSGNTFGSQEASDQFVWKLADEVERRLNRRGSGMGLS